MSEDNKQWTHHCSQSSQETEVCSSRSFLIQPGTYHPCKSKYLLHIYNYVELVIDEDIVPSGSLTGAWY